MSQKSSGTSLKNTANSPEQPSQMEAKIVLNAIKRYRKRKAILSNIRKQIGEGERADAIYELIRFDIGEVEQTIRPVTFGQYQLICASLLATVSRLSPSRRSARYSFSQIEKLSRMIGNHEKSKEVV